MVVIIYTVTVNWKTRVRVHGYGYTGMENTGMENMGTDTKFIKTWRFYWQLTLRSCHRIKYEKMLASRRTAFTKARNRLYFHFLPTCVRFKQPYFQPLHFTIPNQIVSLLTYAHWMFIKDTH